MTKLKLSRRDIRCLKIPYTFSTYLAITPPCIFENTTIRYPFCNKIYGMAIACLLSAGTLYSFYTRSKYYAPIYTETIIILDYVNQCFLVLLALTMVIGTFSNEDNWLKLIRNFQYLDRKFNNVDKEEMYLLKNVNIQFATCLTVFTAMTIYVWYVWVEKMGILVFKLYSINEVCQYCDFVFHILIYNIALAFKNRYQDLNKFLELSLEKGASLREVGQLSRCLHETVEQFNSIFGWPFVFTLSKSVAQLVSCLNFMISRLQLTDDDFNRHVLFINVALVALTCLATATVILSCDAAKLESEKTWVICYKLQESLGDNSKERKELLHLAKQTKECVADFTAARFLKVDRSTLAAIFGTTATYFIVIVQFNLNYENISQSFHN